MRASTIVALAALAAVVQAAAAQRRSPAPGPCAVLCGDLLPAWSPDGRTIAFVLCCELLRR